ncbi:hypothetical protein [Methylophaga sp.]|uniref:hypothetical protein n=1 Tax=Methylophaga sp. TaxID=2024840 RepID=UPI0025E496F4|nr:hypothetical protein [Methylophaga sp.]
MDDEFVLKNGTRVIASKTGDFSDSVVGIIDGYSPHRGPVNSPDNSFYMVMHWQPGETIPSILMTPFVQAEPLITVESVNGVVQVDEYANGTIVEASSNADFSDAILGELAGQLLNDGVPLFVVNYYSHELGMNTTQAFGFIRLHDEEYEQPPVQEPEEPEEPPIVVPEIPPVQTPGVSKPQLFGLITQLENLIHNGQDTAAAMRSVANLYSKPDEVLQELDALRGLIQHHG